jgi:hypothetical protein
MATRLAKTNHEASEAARHRLDVSGMISALVKVGTYTRKFTGRMTQHITGTVWGVTVGRGCGFVEELTALQQTATEALAAAAEAFASEDGTYMWWLRFQGSLTLGDEVRGQAHLREHAAGHRRAW